MFAISVEEFEEKALAGSGILKRLSGKSICLTAMALSPNLSSNR